VIKSIEEKRMDMYSDGMRMINEMRQKDNEGKISRLIIKKLIGEKPRSDEDVRTEIDAAAAAAAVKAIEAAAESEVAAAAAAAAAEIAPPPPAPPPPPSSATKPPAAPSDGGSGE